METKRRALGKGLEELFNNEPLDINKVEEKIIEETPKEQVIEVDLAELRSNPYQPRKNFDEEALNELALSIKEHGVFQPIIVKKSIKGYEIIAGERRAKASMIAGKATIPAIVKDFSDEEMMEIALLENLQRENLTPLEEATAYYKIQQHLNITQEELARRVGKSRSYVTNMLGLLSLPEEVKDYITTGQITMGHARVLSKLNDKEQVKKLTEKIVEEELSVRKLEEITNSPVEFERKNQVKRTRVESNEYEYIAEELCEKLGTKVKIKNNKIEIKFTNANDLNRILEIMNFNR